MNIWGLVRGSTSLCSIVYYLFPPSNRTVCIHSCCFSPNNAQLQLQESDSFHTFFSASRHGERRAVVLHILPASTSVEKAVRETAIRCSTLKQLLHQLNSNFPEITSRIFKLVSAL